MLLKKPKPTPEANLKTGFPYEINTLLHCCFLGNQNQVGQLHHTSYPWSLDYLEHVPWIYLVVPQNTDNSQSWSYSILDQKKKKKKKKPLPPHQSENLRKWILTISPGESNTRQGFEDRTFPRALVSNHCNCRQGQVLFYSKSSQAVDKINAGSDLLHILVVQGVFCSLLELNLQWIFHN